MGSGTVGGEGAACRLTAIALATDLTDLVAGSYIVVHRAGGGSFDSAVLQARSTGFEIIGPPVSGDVSDEAGGGAQQADAVRRLSALEDEDGLGPEWISAVVLAATTNDTTTTTTDGGASSAALRDMIADAHPGVPIVCVYEPAAAAGTLRPQDVETTKRTVDVRPEPAPGAPNAAPSLISRFGALNPDWIIGDDGGATSARPRVRERAVAVGATLALTLALAVAGVAVTGGGADGDADAPAVGQEPADVDVEDGAAATVVTQDDELATSDEVVWTVDFSPEEITDSRLSITFPNSLLQRDDVPDGWQTTPVAPRSDLDKACNYSPATARAAQTSQQFGSPSGKEQAWNLVRIFDSSVSAQVAMKGLELSLERCKGIIRVGGGHPPQRIDIVPLSTAAAAPDVGDASLATSTVTELDDIVTITLYGVARRESCLTYVEYAASFERPAGYTAEPRPRALHHRRFEQLLGAAADQLGRSASNCPSIILR